MRLIFPILFIIIAVGLFFVVIDPLYGQIKQLRADVSTYNIALDNSTELQKTRDSLIDIYKNIKKEDKDRLDHFLPSTINNIELILEIEKIANLYGMPIKDISFGLTDPINKNGDKEVATNDTIIAEANPSDYLPYGVFPVEFIVEGKYDTFVLFLNDLEHNLRLVDIKSISFNVPPPATGPNDKTNTNIYSYKLKVETYWLK